MKRLLKVVGVLLVALGFILANRGWRTLAQSPQSVSAELFPNHLLHSTWQRFEAQGYSHPVTGVIYRGEPRPTCGMPLGGIDTGCLDIEPNGMLGYSTIFNHFLKPRLILNQPFLGLNVGGKTWVLVTDKLGKIDTPTPSFGALFPRTDYTPRYFNIGLDGVEIAKWIDYWGHYPMLDMKYNTTAPVSVASRIWTPFIPGDTVSSMVPGILFEIILQNTSQSSQKGTIALSFPGFEGPKGSAKPVVRAALEGTLTGVDVRSPLQGNQWEMSYVLAATGEKSVRLGGPLNSNGSLWARIGESLPQPGPSESGSSLGYDFSLRPGQSKTVRLILAWHAPNWKSGGAPTHEDTSTFTHMYAKYYPDARTAARILAQDGAELRSRVIAWQDAIYQDSETPGWLADSLINILHLVTEDSVWGQSKGPLEWAGTDGVFGMNECPRGSPQIECLPCSFYGNIPLVYFFPETALSTLRAYKQYQFEDGRPPWVLGTGKTPYDLAKPVRGYQSVLNGACYVVMVDRYWRISGDDGVLKEFWSSLKRANDWSLSLRPSYGMSQIMAMPTPGTDSHGLGDTEWFEAPEPGWKGYVTHAGAIRMAQVIVMRRMAEKMGDQEYVNQCSKWLEAGAKALEEKLWAGQYYLNFHEPETNLKSDLVFGYQLDGEWITDWHGLPGVFPKNRIETTLATIRQINCRLSQSGCVNYANPDNTVAKVGGYGPFSYFPPELFMLAMNFMYEGQKDFGESLLKRSLDNMVLKWGYTWDSINTTQGDKDTGQRAFGADYYQDMMLWAVPAALKGQDLTGPMRSGGLVDRVLKAGKRR